MDRDISRLIIRYTILLFFLSGSFALGLQLRQNTSPQAQYQSKRNEVSEASADSWDGNIEELLQKVGNNGASTLKQLSEYTYSLKKTRRVLDKLGKIKEENRQDFEAYPVSGEHVLIQLTSNGEPLPGWEIDAERRRAGERLLEDEKKKEAPGKSPPAGGKYISAGVYGRTPERYVDLSIDPSAFLQACEFSSPRTEEVDNRKMIVLDFRPRPGISLPPNKAYIARLTGSVWIDANDKVLVRLEAHAAPEDNKAGGRLLYQQSRIAEGVWFPSLIRLNAAGDLTTFDSLNWDVIFEFSDYRRFTTSVAEGKLSEQKKRD